MKPLVTVIIPTRERPDTLKHSIRTVTEQTYSSLEIIVSDNASSPATRKIVESQKDSRIRYINTTERVSMTANYEFALSHATGEWISMIGDDDGILPDGIERGISLLLDTGQKVLSTVPAIYEWPGFLDARHAGYLKINPARGHRIINARKHLQELIDGRLDFLPSPMFYTGGIIHRSVYDELRNRSDNVINSMLPDVYSLFAICSVVDTFVQSLTPLMIAGRSSHSSTASLSSPAANLFFSEVTLPWHADLVDPVTTNSTRAVWLYESYLQSCFLRLENPLNVRPIDQLKLISRQLKWRGPSADQKAFLDWQKRFCAYHGIQSPPSKASLPDVTIDLFETAQIRYRQLFSHKLSGGPKTPLDNVFHATRAAQQLVDENPSLLANIFKFVRGRHDRDAHQRSIT